MSRKPIEEFKTVNYHTPLCLLLDTRALEEKYKELLVFIDHIKECIDTDTRGLNAVDEILERHLGSEG